MKKLASLLLALCLVLGMASFAAADEELPTLDQVVIGENTDLTAKIHFAYHLWKSSGRSIPMSRSNMN